MSDGRDELSSRRRSGAPPGSLQPSADAVATGVRVMAFGPDALAEEDLSDIGRFETLRAAHPCVWVDVVGLGNVDTIREVGELFDMHALALEDVLNVNQRSKTEPFDDHLFVVAHAFVGEDLDDTEQVSFFFGPGWLVTFQERAGDCFEPVRQRLRQGRSRLRSYGADYVCYALLDAILDGYFPIVEALGGWLEEVEEEVLDAPTPESLMRIRQLKRTLLDLRRILWPLRDAIASLGRDDTGLVSDRTAVFLRDCHDHAVRLIELVEMQREMASGLADMYMSSVSHRMNETMKVLTIIATIFIPLSFLAGVYGMNFDYMPELHWRWAYPTLLAGMVTAAVFMLLWFKRRGWL